MHRCRVPLALILAGLLYGACAHAQVHWPHWRGPSGNGIGTSVNLPTTWSAKENIVWKASLPSWSAGTPAIWGDRIFVTSASAATPGSAPAAQPGRRPGGFGGGGFGRGGFRGGAAFGGFGRDPGGPKLLLICLSRKDGKELWSRELDEGNQLWNKQNSSSPSPVTDGKYVWAVTGTGAVVAFDFQGNRVWQRHLQREFGSFAHNWGFASSPLLYAGKLIVPVIHRTDAPSGSYVIAFDARTGKTVWREARRTDAIAEAKDAYTTPALLVLGKTAQIIVSGADYVTGYDPATGKEIWRAGGLNPEKRRNYRIVASPIVAGGMIYAPTRKTPLLALHAGGVGDVTATHLAWKWDGLGAPDVPTPVCDGRYFYMVEDSGRVTCLDAKTGKLIWGPERTVQGIVSSSPLLADGKLYITNETGETTVLAAGPQFKVLATNALEGGHTLASFAVSGNQLFLRSGDALYCIGKKPGRVGS
jgi:outer membrane protein assembly factor BamB